MSAAVSLSPGFSPSGSGQPNQSLFCFTPINVAASRGSE